MIDGVFAAAVIGLAAYRVWRLLAVDVISIRFRAWLFGIDVAVDDPAELGEAPEPEDEAEARFPKLFHMWHCPWCFGSWLAFGLTLAVDVGTDPGLGSPVIVGLAAAAVTGLLGAYDPDQMYGS